MLLTCRITKRSNENIRSYGPCPQRKGRLDGQNLDSSPLEWKTNLTPVAFSVRQIKLETGGFKVAGRSLYTGLPLGPPVGQRRDLVNCAIQGSSVHRLQNLENHSGNYCNCRTYSYAVPRDLSSSSARFHADITLPRTQPTMNALVQSALADVESKLNALPIASQPPLLQGPRGGCR